MGSQRIQCNVHIEQRQKSEKTFARVRSVYMNLKMNLVDVDFNTKASKSQSHRSFDEYEQLVLQTL